MADDTGPLSQAAIDALIASMANDASTTTPKPSVPDPRLTEEETEFGGLIGQPEVPPLETGSWRVPDSGRPSLASIPVTLRAELGKSMATVRQIRQMGEGTRLVLDRRWQEPVLLTLNGQVVGTARVVLVGNRVGVQVVQWGDHIRTNEP